MKTNVSLHQPLRAHLLQSELRVTSVHIKAGEAVKQDALLFEYEEGKAVAPYFSPSSGYIKEVHINEGDLIGPQSVILTFGAQDTAATAQALSTTALPARTLTTDTLQAVLEEQGIKLNTPLTLPSIKDTPLTELALLLYAKHKAKDDPYAPNTVRMLRKFVNRHDAQLNKEIVAEVVALAIAHGGYADGVLKTFSQFIAKLPTAGDTNASMLTQLLMSTRQVVCTDATLYTDTVCSLLVKDRAYTRCLPTLPYIVKGAHYDKASDLIQLIEKSADLLLLADDTEPSKRQLRALAVTYRSFNVAVRLHKIKAIYSKLSQQASKKASSVQLVKRIMQIQ